MNDRIISEFEKLITSINVETDELKKSGDIKKITANNFRIKQLKTVLVVIKNYPEKISIKNYEELKEIGGIGAHTIQRIKEILEKGSLAELSSFKENKEVQNKEKILEELESIVGVGRAKSTELYNEGITSVKMLKQKIKKGEIEVNEKIELGLKYFGKYQTNIPRKEIDKVYKILEKIINSMNKEYKLDESNKYIFEVCGSYRRERPTSGDIDVLVSKIGTVTVTKESKKDDTNHLELVINKLKEKIKLNSDKPLLIDDITDKNFETKYMGFSKYKENPVRRIDVRFVNFDSFYSALLYFTGSADLNKKMRSIAKNKGLKLSEYGLFKADGTKLKIKSEEDFFKALDMDYIEPKFR
jgi:DNA polymerase/3'-5' exonuclease PolX